MGDKYLQIVEQQILPHEDCHKICEIRCLYKLVVDAILFSEVCDDREKSSFYHSVLCWTQVASYKGDSGLGI